MLRRKLIGLVAVMSLLAVGSGSAFADHHGGWSHHGGHHSGHYGGNHGGIYRGGNYRGGYGYGGGYGVRPIVVAPRQVLVPQVYPGYGTGYGMNGCNNGYGSTGFGLYLSR